jgi:hypothetical protein
LAGNGKAARAAPDIAFGYKAAQGPVAVLIIIADGQQNHPPLQGRAAQTAI